MEQRQSMYKLALMRSRSLDAKRVVKAEHGRARAEPRGQAGRQAGPQSFRREIKVGGAPNGRATFPELERP